MSKGAVRSLTKHASQVLGEDNIRVNTVMPGVMFTEMTVKLGFHSREELGAIYKGTAVLPPYAGEADDIGNIYLFLASDESKYATGAEFIIDGGWVASSGHASDGRTYE
jgi:NAD(P)-dependent dehydrogenase (short-subunit alcohol dehydrogenase family)